MGRNKKHRHRHRKLFSLFNLIKAINSTDQTKKEELIEVTHQFTLTQTDRITYVYQSDKKLVVRRVTCVSYDALIGGEWHTIVYYDSCHAGVLHRHTRILLSDQRDIVSLAGVKKNGTQKQLLTWAIKDITKNFLAYRRYFTRKNRVDMY